MALCGFAAIISLLTVAAYVVVALLGIVTLGLAWLLFGLVFGSYLMSGGNLGVIIEAAPHELMAIGGARVLTPHLAARCWRDL